MLFQQQQKSTTFKLYTLEIASRHYIFNLAIELTVTVCSPFGIRIRDSPEPQMSPKVVSQFLVPTVKLRRADVNTLENRELACNHSHSLCRRKRSGTHQILPVKSSKCKQVIFTYYAIFKGMVTR